MMKTNKWYYLLLLCLCMGMAACGGDDSDDFNVNPINQNEDNQEPTDLELNAENLAKFVKANISYNVDEWLYTANIQTSLMSSPLAGKVAGKTMKYGMIVDIIFDSPYHAEKYGNIKVNYLYTGDTPPGQGIYADGEGDSYVVSVEAPIYAGVYSGQNALDKYYGDFQTWFNILNMVGNIQEHIDQGRATDTELRVYESLLGEYYAMKDATLSYTEDLYWYCSYVAQVFVEIGGSKYIVAERTDDPVRLMTYSDIGYNINIK